MKKSSKTERDVEKGYARADFVAKLRRLADAVESGGRFQIQIAGERIRIPVRARFTVEHERSEREEEIEFQVKWERDESGTAERRVGTRRLSAGEERRTATRSSTRRPTRASL